MTTRQQQQIAVLSNLRPETIIDLEGVGFITRARGLPGVTDARESIGEVEIVGAKEGAGTIDIAHELRLDPDTQERMVTVGKFVVAGGLCYDQDSQDPLEEGSANGNLYHRGRRAHGGEEANFYEAIGYDSYGEKDLQAAVVSEELAKRVLAEVCKDRSLMAALSARLAVQWQPANWAGVKARIAQAIQQDGWEYAIDYVAEYFLDVAYFRDATDEWQHKLGPLVDLLTESEAEAAWERAVAAGTIGNPRAVLLDIYEHGGIVYSVAGHGMQCRWDTTRGGAVWVPDADLEENIRYNVLRTLGVGEIKWFGVLSVEGSTLNARYSLDGGTTWVGEGQSWKWRQAMDAMVAASGRTIETAQLNALMVAEAEKYCAAILESYNDWRNGEVYGVVVYVIDRATGRRVEDEDDECWGFIGSDYAEKELEDIILAKVQRLGATYQ